ncbi:hypothetical protein [Mucilaginibacter terrae]|uniref:Uncharacterized protein n=1 Tax=Mucilaginibacter terrae TaxID=1955052 RepID=A0ABU3H320_9SPHI|nr:hypothetical protein [Mucilaginibacter terrae]MDT3405637.1 hypothetical protein [Mucilaginibacter terrae]
MKIRITPLNFATAFFLVLALVTWLFKPASIINKQPQQLSGAIALIFLVYAVGSAFLDLIFRNLFKELKTLWLVEGSFIVFTAVIYLLVK